MSKPFEKYAGIFIVPAKHLHELHALEAAAGEAERRHDPLEMELYRKNQIFEHAREVAQASAVITLSDGLEYIAFDAWFRRRFRNGDDREVMDPDELAAVARELPSISVEDMSKWLRKHRRRYGKLDPAIMNELFDALVRTVSAAPAEPCGLVIRLFREEYRDPPPPPKPTPAYEPPEDTSRHMGWFAVPARHMAELQDLIARRDQAFREDRLPDFYQYESRLFERAGELATTSAIFDTETHRMAGEFIWTWMEQSYHTLLMFLDPDERQSWSSRLSRTTLEDLTHDRAEEQLPAHLGELSQSLIRVLCCHPRRRLCFVAAWFFDAYPAEPQGDPATKFAARTRAYQLADQRDALEAILRKLETRQRRAAARRKTGDNARNSAQTAASAARASSPDAAHALPREELAAIERELASRFPWLGRLSGGNDILSAFAQRIAWARRARSKRSAPDAARMRDALPARISVALRELLADDFQGGATAMERAGRAAMVAEIERHAGTVELAMPRGKPDVRVCIDGKRLGMDRDTDSGRLPVEAFFARGGGALLEVQSAYYTAMRDQAGRELEALIKAHRWLTGLLVEYHLRKQIAADRREAALRELADAPSHAPSPEANDVLANDVLAEMFMALFPDSKATKVIADIRARERDPDAR